MGSSWRQTDDACNGAGAQRVPTSRSQDLENLIDRAVRQTFADADRDDSIQPVVSRGGELRFGAVQYPTYELDAAAAVAGAGVALLSPTLFGSLVCEGKLIQPFPTILQGPSWHFLLLKPGAARASVHAFRSWLQAEIRRDRSGGESHVLIGPTLE